MEAGFWDLPASATAMTDGQDYEELTLVRNTRMANANLLWNHPMGLKPPLFKPESQEEVLHDLSERPMVAIGG
jgi:hypothetical protein